MTQPKIAFLVKDGQHKLVVVPELPPKPKEPTSRHWAATGKWEVYEQITLPNWQSECARLMENAPEILHPFKIVESNPNSKIFYIIEANVIIVIVKHGDQFPLPEGLELREELQTRYPWNRMWVPCSNQYYERRKVFRIVRAEVKQITREICRRWKDNDGLCQGNCYFKGSALKECEVKPEPESQVTFTRNEVYSLISWMQRCRDWHIHSVAPPVLTMFEEIQRKKQ